MASIHQEITVDRDAEHCWEALRDVGALHTRLVPGFVTHTQLEPGARIVTFGNGMTLKELIVDVCDERRRVAWSVVGGPFEHHNASVEVHDEGRGTCRMVWVADLLPDTIEGQIRGMIEQAMGVMKKTLERG